MSRGIAQFWSWVLVTAIVAVATLPRLRGVCVCLDPAGGAAAVVGVDGGDSCCVPHASSDAARDAAKGSENQPGKQPEKPGHDGHGCSCDLACCGVMRPALTPGHAGLVRVGVPPSGVLALPTAQSHASPGFPGDLFRPPRA